MPRDTTSTELRFCEKEMRECWTPQFRSGQRRIEVLDQTRQVEPEI